MTNRLTTATLRLQAMGIKVELTNIPGLFLVEGNELTCNQLVTYKLKPDPLAGTPDSLVG